MHSVFWNQHFSPKIWYWVCLCCKFFFQNGEHRFKRSEFKWFSIFLKFLSLILRLCVCIEISAISHEQKLLAGLNMVQIIIIVIIIIVVVLLLRIIIIFWWTLKPNTIHSNLQPLLSAWNIEWTSTEMKIYILHAKTTRCQVVIATQKSNLIPFTLSLSLKSFKFLG